MADPDAWLEGHGWDADRWGGWPSAADLETVAPGRRGAFWAHDHHALLASRAALVDGRDRSRHAGPARWRHRPRRDGDPDGMLYEMGDPPGRSSCIPPMSTTELEAAIVAISQELLALGVVAAHDPGRLTPDPDLGVGVSRLRPPVRDGPLPIRVLASIRDDALETALAGGLRSGDVLGADPGRTRADRLAEGFADGSLGSRTAALLADIEPEPDRPLPEELRRGRLDHPSARRCASWSIARPRVASRPRSTRSATPRSGPRSTR